MSKDYIKLCGRKFNENSKGIIGINYFNSCKHAYSCWINT